MRRTLSRILVAGLGLFLVSSGLAAPPELPDGTNAATKKIATFRIPEGMKVELFAAEPKLASPVAIGLDEKNRVFVAEEYRFNLGTEENRTRPFLLEDDLQIQTLDDRLKMYEKHASKFEGGMEWFRKVADQVRLVEDTDGDGKADRSTIFAPDFNGTLDGLAAGVMATDGDVYFTCIPNLWRLRDTDNDGVADVREIIHTGFGINAGFLGHDLHGLCWGPDGKLYFSVGDRGFHVTTKEGRILHGPRNGAVFRCYPDGSELEVVCRGLRNPQEIAFDQFGNLFAADNNCDKGDHSRLVYCLEGSDSGWNMAYQSILDPYLTGPWHAEKMWHLWESRLSSLDSQRPQWVLPPVGKLGAGPSGFTYYPGTGLPPRYDNHFFLCNYTGNGGIESFGTKPRGAGFEIVDEHDFLKPIMASDCEFGYDGKLYVSDFFNLIWNGGSSGGRIYTLFDTRHVNDAATKQTAELFRNGFKGLSFEKLTELLSHPDMRVRQRAQFALAARGSESVRFLQATLNTSNNRFARLHALWGLGQLAAKSKDGQERPSYKLIVSYLEDTDGEVRAHATRLVGDLRYPPAAELLVKQLTDESLRVRLFAAQSLGKLKHQPALPAIVALLRDNADADPWLRHAGVMALAAVTDAESLGRVARDASPSVRLASLLALRQRVLKPLQEWTTEEEKTSRSVHSAESNADAKAIVAFLRDEQIALVTEAARAINDIPLDAATAELASVSLKPSSTPGAEIPDPLARRVINANMRLGGVEHADRVIAIVVEPRWTMSLRREALAALIDWNAPSSRDRVNGFWRPVPPRDDATKTAITSLLTDRVALLLAGAPPELQPDVVKLIAKYKLPTDDAVFAGWVADPAKSVIARGAALRLLATRNAKQLDESLAVALKSDLAPLRADARDLIASLRPVDAIPLLDATLASDTASILERQRAVTMLATLRTAAADAILKRWTDKLLADQVPESLQLDVMEAATARDLPDLKAAVDQFKAKLTSGDVLARYQPSLQGGDAERGREVFLGHRVGQCVRCHSVTDSTSKSVIHAGGTAGPNLFEVAKRHDRLALLQSLVDPSAKIAKGYETVTLVLNDGRTFGGVIRKEDASEIQLEQPDGKLITFKPSDIDERTPPKSAMPEMNRALSPRELRDLVEFLTTLK